MGAVKFLTLSNEVMSKAAIADHMSLCFYGAHKL